MKTFLKLVVLSLMTMNLTACAGSDGGSSNPDAAPQAHAESLTAEQNRLRSELIGMGDISTNWDNAKIDLFESKLSRIEAVERELAAVNGKNGVTISGANNSALFAQLRSTIAKVRAQKVKEATFQNILAEVKTQEAKAAELVKAIQEDIGAMLNQTDPEEVATAKQVVDSNLAALEAVYNKQAGLIRELDARGHNTGSAAAQVKSAIEAVKEQRKNVAGYSLSAT